jgi:uncharacterized membrane protein YfcA
MSIYLFSFLICIGSAFAGFLGSLTGLGGGVVIVPMLVLVFGVDIRYAIGASLVAVIATSSAAAATYVRDGYSNMRIGMFLEIATTLGAVTGAFVAAKLSSAVISIIFGAVLLHSAYLSFRTRQTHEVVDRPDKLAVSLRLDGTFPGTTGPVSYHVQGVPLGFALMFGAGSLSGLLGIGSGAVKVLAMDRVMLIPFKVSTTTSNFMIGVTAAASAGVYLNRGYLNPGLIMPVMLGVLTGAMFGSRLLASSKIRTLRIVFSIVILLLSVEMIYNGLTGRF